MISIDTYGEIILDKFLNKALSFFMFLILLGFIVACGDFEKKISYKYTLLKTNAYNHSIRRGDEFIVLPNVVSLNCDNRFIYGLRKKSIRPDYLFDGSTFEDERYFGYFIIDINTDKINFYSKKSIESNLKIVDITNVLILADKFNKCDL